MKKTIQISGCLLFALIILLPFAKVFFACFGCTVELINYPVFAIVTALLSVSIVVFCIVTKEKVVNKRARVWVSLLTPLSLINAVFYMLAWSSRGVITSVFVCVVCCCYLTIRYGKPVALKITALAVSAFMAVPIVFVGFILFIFGNIGQNTVIRSIESPDGAYYAEVIDSDQGALGGDTLVDVYENKSINALVFKISRKPQRVYQGDWGEFENMEIYWESDNCLVINSVGYEIGLQHFRWVSHASSARSAQVR